MRSVLVAAFLLLVTTYPTAAQETTRTEESRRQRFEKRERLHPPDSAGPFQRLLGRIERRLESPRQGRGFYGFGPKAGGLKPGAGLAGGIRFAPLSPASSSLLLVDALASLERYWGIGALGGYRFRSGSALAFARYRHMPKERFFGFGPDSEREERSDFRLNEAVAGTLIDLRLGSGFSVGGRSSYVVSTPGPGRDDDVSDAVDRFPGRLPSLQSEAHHITFGGWIEYDGRDPGGSSPLFRYLAPTESDVVGIPLATDRGVYALAEIVHYEDVGATGSSFSRLHLQSQQFVPFRRGRNVFVLREYLSLSDARGGRIPLYMQPALGGAYTLRGYDLFRFRDRHALLLNAEYRWKIWLFMDLALFADAGQVFAAADDLSLARLHGSYGAGIRLRGPTKGLARLDVGRSAEGTRVYVRVGTHF